MIRRKPYRSTNVVAGAAIRARRQELGLTLTSFSKLVGVAHSFVGDVETGLCPLPIARIAQFAEALQMPELPHVMGVCPECQGTGRRKGAA